MPEFKTVHTLLSFQPLSSWDSSLLLWSTPSLPGLMPAILLVPLHLPLMFISLPSLGSTSKSVLSSRNPLVVIHSNFPLLIFDMLFTFISKLCKNFLTFRLVQVNKWKNEKVDIEICDKWLFLDEFCCFFQVLYFRKNARKSTFSKKTGYFGTYDAFWPFSLAQAWTSLK